MKNKRNTLIINFFGAPGTGKSTASADLYYKMKKRGYSVELVSEYAKELVYENNLEKLKDQLFITSSQNHRLEMLVNKVDYIITDSPLPLGLLYTNKNYIKDFHDFIINLFLTYNNYNFLLNHNNDFLYENNARLQNEDESKKLQNKLEEILYENLIETTPYDAKKFLKYLKKIKIRENNYDI